jgi:ATP-dependent 26S proteasome regulatory subunit
MSGQDDRDSGPGRGEADRAAREPVLTDADAVRLAYSREIVRAAGLLESGLSVLVTCDKLVVEDLWQAIVGRSGRTALPSGDAAGSQSGLAHLRELLAAQPAADGQVIVLRHIDLLADPGLSGDGAENVPPPAAAELTELLYAAKDRILLAFADPSLPLPDVTAARFAARLTLRGVPRETWDPEHDTVRPLAVSLLTAAEHARFEGVDSRQLHRHVSGLNPVRLRQAIRYATRDRDRQDRATAEDLYQSIREFKALTFPVTRQDSGVTFDDIGGYADVKTEIQQLLDLIDRQHEGRSGLAWLRKELLPRGLLFYGPPGTGKTLFAKAMASAWNVSFIPCSGPELTGRDVAETVRNLNRIFAEAARAAPALLLLDEFDAIAPRHPDRDDEEASWPAAAIANRMIAAIDQIGENAPVLIVGTTNRLDIIDPALLRPSRLRAIHIGLPAEPEERIQIAAKCAKKFDVTLSAELLESVSNATNGLTGREINEVFREAALQAFRDDQPVSARLLGEAVGRMRMKQQLSDFQTVPQERPRRVQPPFILTVSPSVTLSEDDA